MDHWFLWRTVVVLSISIISSFDSSVPINVTRKISVLTEYRKHYAFIFYCSCWIDTKIDLYGTGSHVDESMILGEISNELGIVLFFVCIEPYQFLLFIIFIFIIFLCVDFLMNVFLVLVLWFYFSVIGEPSIKWIKH